MSSERTAKRRCRWLVTVVTAPTPEAGLVAAAEPSLKYEYLQRRLLRRRACALQHRRENRVGNVKTGKTSPSARINIWINPGFLMQSGALAIPSVERRLLDELSKPRWPKEINWKPPPPPFSPSGH